MGISQSSASSARGTHDTNKALYDGRNGEYGEVQIRSKKLERTLRTVGIHHLVRFSLPNSSQRTWAIFEWTDRGLDSYTCDCIESFYCTNFGSFYLKDVYRAALAASNNRSYSLTSYNCNHWVEQFAWNLNNMDIRVSGLNCGCISGRK